MRKYLKRIFLSVSVFIALMSFSCQSNLSEFVDNEDIVFSALSRSVKNSVEKGVVYPKGVIPQWVKDSLSEEGYALVCQLSRKYEMTYYPLSLKGKERMSLRNENTNQRTIDVLLSIPEEQLNYSIEENLIDMNVPRLKVLNAESEGDGWDGEDGDDGWDGGDSEGGGSGEFDEYEFASQTNRVYQKNYVIFRVYVDVSTGYLYDSDEDVAVDIQSLNVNIDHYGFSGLLSWEERSTMGRIIDEGKTLELHVNGRIKSSIEIEGIIGSDLILDKVYKTIECDVIPGYDDDAL